MPPPPPSPASGDPQAWGCACVPMLQCSLKWGERRVCREGPIFRCTTRSPRSSAMQPTFLRHWQETALSYSLPPAHQGYPGPDSAVSKPCHAHPHVPDQSSSVLTGSCWTEHTGVSACTTQSPSALSVVGGWPAGPGSAPSTLKAPCQQPLASHTQPKAQLSGWVAGLPQWRQSREAKAKPPRAS